MIKIFFVFSFIGLFLIRNIYCQVPKIFEAGIISSGDYDTHPAFSPTGDTLFFVKCSPDFNFWKIFVSYKSNGKWSEPVIAGFSEYIDADPFFSKDGKTLYFISTRPLDKNDSAKTDLDIWKVLKTQNGWSNPIHLDAPINSNEDEFYPTLSDNETMYFGSKRKGGEGACDIYKCELVDGKYQTTENLGNSINTPDNEYEPFISTDEEFLIFMATRPKGLTNADLYISYNENGKWTKAEKLPAPFNSDNPEFSPKITWDGKYFVFSSTRNTNKFFKQESTGKFNTKIRSAGNGLGDIYIIESSNLNFLKQKK